MTLTTTSEIIQRSASPLIQPQTDENQTDTSAPPLTLAGCSHDTSFQPITGRHDRPVWCGTSPTFDLSISHVPLFTRSCQTAVNQQIDLWQYLCQLLMMVLMQN